MPKLNRPQNPDVATGRVTSKPEVNFSIADRPSAMSRERAPRPILRDKGHCAGRCCAFHINTALLPSFNLRGH